MRKDAKELEKIVKGVANHWRIKIMKLLADKPGLSLLAITDELEMNFKTASEHVKKLHMSGLVSKKYISQSVEHSLTSRGSNFLRFLVKLK